MENIKNKIRNRHMSDITVGLFGTCGGSQWRTPFIESYNKMGIESFNPQVDDWTPAFADIEADHLVNDDIILFPVTDESSGLGSLAETGFSMFQAVKTNENRFFVFYVAPQVNPEKVTDPAIAKESNRARSLVRAHFRKNTNPNIFVCDSVEQMLEVSLKLAQSLKFVKEARNILTSTPERKPKF